LRLKLSVLESTSLKEGLEGYVRLQSVEAIVMGTRNSDPHSLHLHPFSPTDKVFTFTSLLEQEEEIEEKKEKRERESFSFLRQITGVAKGHESDANIGMEILSYMEIFEVFRVTILPSLR